MGDELLGSRRAGWLTGGVLSGLRTTEGGQGIQALVADPDRALMAFDYDGTLAPIVEDPGHAWPQPGIVEALSRLAERVGQVAIVTGRPAQVAVDLAGLADVSGLTDLVVVGHYGMERWHARTGKVETTKAPSGVDQIRREVPRLLKSFELSGAVIEDKGLSIAVHVRRLPDPQRALDVIRGPLTELAERAGLAAEPGRFVMELRPRGMDKGQALRRLADDFDALSVMFTGDDLGDLAAFAEVGRLREEGVPGLLVCSGSAEVSALAEQADIVVDGPAGVAALIADLVGAMH